MTLNAKDALFNGRKESIAKVKREILLILESIMR